MDKKQILKLYILGQTDCSQRAVKNLKKIMTGDLKSIYDLRIIDVLKNPQLAEKDKIIATPTLIKVLPLPLRKIIGDLSDKEKVLLGLNLTIEK